MSIHDEAVDAALKATNAAGYRHITALSVVAILEAAAPKLLIETAKQLQKDNPGNPVAWLRERAHLMEEAK